MVQYTLQVQTEQWLNQAVEVLHNVQLADEVHKSPTPEFTHLRKIRLFFSVLLLVVFRWCAFSLPTSFARLFYRQLLEVTLHLALSRCPLTDPPVFRSFS